MSAEPVQLTRSHSFLPPMLQETLDLMRAVVAFELNGNQLRQAAPFSDQLLRLRLEQTH